MVTTQKNRQLQLPIERPDETLYSLVGRIRSRNVYRSDLDACRHLLGWVSNCRVDEYPVDLGCFCQETSAEYGASAQVLEHFTLFPYFASTSKFPWHSGTAKLSPLEVRHGLGLLSCGVHQPWRICDECIEEENSKFGDTYWHRSHQLPISLVCSKHLRPLLCLQETKGVRNRLLLPEDIYSHCKVLDTDSHVLEQWAAIAKIDKAVLDNSLSAGISKDCALAVLLHALEEHNLLDKNGAVNKPAFANFYTASLVDMRLPESWLKQADWRGVRGPVVALANKTLPGSEYFALLVFQLFGCWEAFEERCRWEAVMSVNSSNRSHMPSLVISDMEAHRQTCTSLLEQIPALTRSQFARAAPKSFRWLLTNDKHWFEKRLPDGSSTPQLKLFN